jgi:hypothetical protein
LKISKISLSFLSNIDKNSDWKTNALSTALPVLGPREETVNTGGSPGKHLFEVN